jgi:hypothetical protein
MMEYTNGRPKQNKFSSFYRDDGRQIFECRMKINRRGEAKANINSIDEKERNAFICEAQKVHRKWCNDQQDRIFSKSKNPF